MKQKLLLLCMALLTAVTASAYHFSAENKDGVTIYYDIVDIENHHVMVVGVDTQYYGDVVIPESIEYSTTDSVSSIGDYAFDSCTGLTSVTIPYSVTSIGNCAFYGCSGLTSVTIPNSVTSIGVGAFDNCTHLNSVTIPNSVTSIGEKAFIGCSGLTSVTIPNSVTSIDYCTFYGCSGLTSVTIPNSVTSIGVGAFEWCSGLTSVSIPNSVTNIGSGAFDRCSSLTSVTISNSVTSIGDHAFCYCSGLTSVTIPNSVTSIGKEAFCYCTGLTSATIGNSVTSIGDYTFSGCMNLSSVTIGNSVQSIGDGAFSGSQIQYLRIGENLKSIGSGVFSSTPLIEIAAITPPSLAKDAFPEEMLAEITVIVPSADTETAYRKAAVWSDMTFTNPSNVAEVNVETPGKLSVDLVKQCDMMPAKVVSLKVKGTLDNADFEQMRINMKALISLDLSEVENASIPDNALSQKLQLQSLVLPANAKSIGANAFDHCPYLSGELSLPSGLTEIGNEAFRGSGYSSFVLPSRMERIGDGAFADMPLDMTLRLPETVKAIGSEAFMNTGVKGHLTFPDAVKSLGDRAFAGTQISSVFLPRSVASLGKALFQNCPNLDVVDVPNNITSIKGYAFQNCSSLVNLRLPSNADELGEYALSATPIDYLVISNGIKTLSEGVMQGCGQMISLTLPYSLEDLQPYALNGCRKLRNLSVNATVPPTVADATVLRGINTDKCVISIPTTAFEDYLLAPYWGQFVQMRNDISVTSEGNGENTYEAVEEEENGGEETPARAARRIAMHRIGAATAANDGTSIFIPKGDKIRFFFNPGEGESLVSVTLDGVDITDKIENGSYVATADKKNGKLYVKYTGTTPASLQSAWGDDDSRCGAVYNMQGICVKRNATAADLENLPSGIYIANGKKVIVK